MSAVPGSVFITGTDTSVGKTRIACGLLHALRNAGRSAAGYKPVASGASASAGGWRNEDALALQAASAPGLAYEAINPYCFAEPIAPHLAARLAATSIDLARLDAAYAMLARAHQHVVIEGAGGWLVPLNDTHTFADWVQAHQWPVILIVGVRLGCINHALLSAEAIQRRTPLLGWIANHLPPQADAGAEIVECLRLRLPAPLLAQVAEGANHDQIAEQLSAIVAWSPQRG